MSAQHRLICLIRTASWGIALFSIALTSASAGLQASGKENDAMLIVTSQSFMHQRGIPARHTCDGFNSSPPLAWSGVPAGTKSLALIVDDPDAPDPAAPKKTWVHWVLYNIPPDANGLPEGVAAKDLPSGTLQGTNDSRGTGIWGALPADRQASLFFQAVCAGYGVAGYETPCQDSAGKGHAGPCACACRASRLVRAAITSEKES